MSLGEEFNAFYFILMGSAIGVYFMFSVMSVGYSLLSKTEGPVDLSATPSEDASISGQQRSSIVPQAVFYDAMVRLSGGTPPSMPARESSKESPSLKDTPVMQARESSKENPSLNDTSVNSK